MYGMCVMSKDAGSTLLKIEEPKREHLVSKTLLDLRPLSDCDDSKSFDAHFPRLTCRNHAPKKCSFYKEIACVSEELLVVEQGPPATTGAGSSSSSTRTTTTEAKVRHFRKSSNKSSGKQSWRSKTWKSKAKSSKATAESTGSTLESSLQEGSQYARKYSLTVPGEAYLQHHHHHHHHHHQVLKQPVMGHQQQQEHKPVETKQSEVKMEQSKTPSPLSTPSPSGSLAGDEPSGCSSCSSSGLDIELNRKCTVSADSLLLHPDIAGMSRSVEKSDNDDDDQRLSRSPGFLDPQSLLGRRKISASISSDQIHKHSSMFLEEEELERHSSSRHSPENKPSTSSSVGGHPESAVRRKESVTQIMLSGPARIAKLLRRTHSAGCSKDVPSYALFLREKPAQKRHKSPNGGQASSSTTGESHQTRHTKKHQIALEDMKQRLRFLRRRNTDTALESSSVRPSPEEAQKWSQSFLHLMRSRYGMTLFKAFLAKEFSEENMEFWIACEEYKSSRPSKFPSKAKKIYENYIAVKSPKEVNLDYKLRTEISTCLANPDVNSFDLAQRKVQGLLETDSYPRFLQSELYRELLRPVKLEERGVTSETMTKSDEQGKQSPESSL